MQVQHQLIALVHVGETDEFGGDVATAVGDDFDGDCARGEVGELAAQPGRLRLGVGGEEEVGFGNVLQVIAQLAGDAQVEQVADDADPRHW